MCKKIINPSGFEVSLLPKGPKFKSTAKKQALRIRRILKETSGYVCSPLEMIGNLLWLTNLDISLCLIQGIGMLTVSHSIWAVWKKDYRTLRFLLEDIIIILGENRFYCAICENYCERC